MLIHALSLCSGVEGLGRGLAAVLPNLRTVAYCEADPFCHAVLCARMDDGWLDRAPIWPDLRTLDGRAWRGRVDLVFGGPPCQGFSVAGKRRGEHDSRNLLPDTLRVIRECEPAGVFLENVPGALPYFFHVVLPELQAMGYRTAAGLFRASDVGAPHRRERLFVLGYLADGRSVQRFSEREQAGESEESSEQQYARSGGTESLADRAGERWDGLGLQGSLSRRTVGESGFPPWPPGPTEWDRWAEILERWPELAPALGYPKRSGRDRRASFRARSARSAAATGR